MEYDVKLVSELKEEKLKLEGIKRAIGERKTVSNNIKNTFRTLNNTTLSQNM